MSKRKREEKSESDSSSSESEKTKFHLPGHIPPISKEDYYRRNQEFQVWLLDAHKKKFTDLPTKKLQRSYFKKFTKKWNSGKLDEKYYSVGSRGVPLSERTSYQWKFNDVKTKREVEEELLFGPVPIPVKRDVPLGPSDIPPEITEEERREQERKKTKLEIKKYNKRKEAVLEEIAPKPSTPRESKMEKNKIKKISVSPFFPFPISPSLSFSSPTESRKRRQ
eukprot:TRINITY_DN4140_c0_g1_i1.p1 TRINITY_DN4140_c0_g1~~TRINITY_DN4140_c0_g1_i1.p1  ORF type:complete len:222 (-),score=87.11 TRINITY_DN4140_c0_g1_i1:217-882(-)